MLWWDYSEWYSYNYHCASFVTGFSVSFSDSTNDQTQRSPLNCFNWIFILMQMTHAILKVIWVRIPRHKINENIMLLSNVQCVEEDITFWLFPVGYPHRADTVRLRGKVLEVDHYPITSLGDNHWALNTCNQETQEVIKQTEDLSFWNKQRNVEEMKIFYPFILQPLSFFYIWFLLVKDTDGRVIAWWPTCPWWPRLRDSVRGVYIFPVNCLDIFLRNIFGFFPKTKKETKKNKVS